MVQPLRTFVVLAFLAIFLAQAVDFSPCTNYILTSAFYNSATVKFSSQLLGSSTFVETSPTQSDISDKVTCSSTYMNNYAWSLKGTFLGCTSSSEFGLGIWVNFESTLGDGIMQFGPSTGFPNGYRVSSDEETTLKFSFWGSNYYVMNLNDFSIDVTLNEWTFLTFHWIDTNFKIYMPGKDVISKTARGASPFANPTAGEFSIGKSMKAKIYQILGFNTASINENKAVITLSDGSATYDATGTCSGVCNDPFCHPSQKCLSSTSDCKTCNSSGCSECTTNGNSASDYCNVPCPSNCKKCSAAKVCTQCEPSYFLYDNAGEATCISCASSCTSCLPGPSCFLCAESIVKDGSECRVDSIGFQISFSPPNLEIQFAHPLQSKLALGAVSAKSSQNADIDTNNWILKPCLASSPSCIIATDNMSESLLPIKVDFEFSKDS